MYVFFLRHVIEEKQQQKKLLTRFKIIKKNKKCLYFDTFTLQICD